MEANVITCPKCGAADVENINGTEEAVVQRGKCLELEKCDVREENAPRPVEPSAVLRAPKDPILIMIPPDDQLGST